MFIRRNQSRAAVRSLATIRPRRRATRLWLSLPLAAAALLAGAVTLPQSLPGIAAGSLLVFIPAVGDFINTQFLGNPNTTMIGSVVQDQFLVQVNYPEAAALSLVLMAIITAMVLVYSRLFGTEALAA